MKATRWASVAVAALAVGGLALCGEPAMAAGTTKVGMVKATPSGHVYTAQEKQTIIARSHKTALASPTLIDKRPPPTGTNPPPATPIQAATGSTPDSWTATQDELLENRVETCLANEPVGFYWSGLVINHLAGCSTGLGNAVVWDINGAVVASAPFKVTTLYEAMKPGDPTRRFRASSYVTVGESTGQSQALIDQVNNGPIRFNLPCGLGAGATFCTISGTTTMSVSQWRANNDSGPVSFTFDAKDGDGWTGAAGDNLATYNVGWVMEWVGGTKVENPGIWVRCDYATAMTSPVTGCVFPAGTNRFERNSLSDASVAQAADHIFNALYFPNSTDPLPTKIGSVKFIPGLQSSGSPLTRLWTASGRENKANHDRALRACRSLPGTYPAGYECDEFPFASTWEGAASGGDFSVRMIDGDQNRRSGNFYLNRWYNAFRILNNDAFFVDVRP